MSLTEQYSLEEIVDTLGLSLDGDGASQVRAAPTRDADVIDPDIERARLECEIVLAETATAGDGERNDHLYAFICAVRERASAGPDLCYEFGLRFATEKCIPPYDEGQARATIRSAIRSARNPAGSRSEIQEIQHAAAVQDFVDLGELPPTEKPTEVKDSTTTPLRFAGVSAHEFATRQSPPWIVRGILPKAELATIIGPSGSGKSFFAFDLACHIAQGLPWRDHKTTAGKVAYVVAEGAGYFPHRTVAWSQRYAIPLEEMNVSFFPHSPNVMLKDDVRDLIIAIQRRGAFDVIIIDTFAQITPGANENAAEDMGRALANLKAVHRATGALIVLVHHVGKDEARGSRGWSGIKAAADAEITITRINDMRKATLSKLKDGADGVELPFKLADVTIGMDEENEAITTCVVEHVTASEGKKEKKPPAGLQRDVWEWVKGELTQYKELDTGKVLDGFVKTRVVDTSKKGSRSRCRDTARVALQNLVQAGWLHVENDVVRGIDGT